MIRRSDIILTREAAKILGMSMSRVRRLATDGTLTSTRLGPRAIVFSRVAVEKLAASRATLRAAGSMRGVLPQGFSTDRRY